MPPSVQSFMWLFVGGMLVFSPSLFKASRYFATIGLSHVRSARLDHVVAARESAEKIPYWPRLACGIVLLVVYALERKGIVPAPSEYLLCFSAVAVMLVTSVIYFKHTVRRRAALLEPRRSAVPKMILTLAAVALLMFALQAALARDTLGIASVLVGTIVVWTGFAVAAAPALMTGDDIEVEAFLDGRLRTRRAFYLLNVGVFYSYLFVFIFEKQAFVGAIVALVPWIALVLYFGMRDEAMDLATALALPESESA